MKSRARLHGKNNEGLVKECEGRGEREKEHRKERELSSSLCNRKQKVGKFQERESEKKKGKRASEEKAKKKGKKRVRGRRKDQDVLAS